jgi:hypothetical protein
MNKPWTEPTPDSVRAACEEFDGWNDNPDPALKLLFEQFQENTHFEPVFLKVVALNTAYSTQIRAVSNKTPTVYDVARHIVSLKIDDALRQGSMDLVEQIANVTTKDGRHQRNYSFATKYCSWHQHDFFPIYDSRVDEYLWQLRNREKGMPDGFRQFKRMELESYPTFKRVVVDFQTHFHLEEFSFKKIDKFLFVEGGRFWGSDNSSMFDAGHTAALE